MSSRADVDSLIGSGDYDGALRLLRGSDDPSDALLRVRCRAGDRGYYRLCDRAEILADVKASGDGRDLVDVLSEFASPDPEVFSERAVEMEVDAVRARASRDVATITSFVNSRHDLGAADLRVICDAVVSVYRDHPLFPDLLVSADMWDVVRYRGYLHSLDVTCSVNGDPRTPEALYTALAALRRKLLLVKDSGCDLAHLTEADVSKIIEHGSALADRRYPLRGLGKLTNRGAHDAMVDEYRSVADDVSGMIREADRMRDVIRSGIVVDAWDFREQ